MTFDEMYAAVKGAELTLTHADKLADKFARLLLGRLRNVDSQWVLAALKDELRSFNAHTKRWNG